MHKCKLQIFYPKPERHFRIIFFILFCSLISTSIHSETNAFLECVMKSGDHLHFDLPPDKEWIVTDHEYKHDSKLLGIPHRVVISRVTGSITSYMATFSAGKTLYDKPIYLPYDKGVCKVYENTNKF